ncbi:hypothetical protein FRB90_012797 [Tulasnella sp. 427]|nr:hypothetical protein FRB90_012797 [Tulasnella sp. 427]
MYSQLLPRSLAKLLRIASLSVHDLPTHVGHNIQTDPRHAEGVPADYPPSGDLGMQSEKSPADEVLGIAWGLPKKNPPFFTASASCEMIPKVPTQGDRYRRQRRLPDSENSDEVLFFPGPQPIQQTYDLPPGWDEDVHPEGQLLYSTVVPSRDLKIRVHTDLPLRVKENQEIIANARNKLVDLLDACDKLHSSGVRGSDIEACIIVSAANPNEIGYYLANHRAQTVFWLHEVNPVKDLELWSEDEDIYQLKLTAQYWRYVTDFPHHCTLSQRALDQLGPSVLLGAMGNTVENRRQPKILNRWLSLPPGGAKQEKKLTPKEIKLHVTGFAVRIALNPVRISFLSLAFVWAARIWYDITTARSVNYWGTDYARLEQGTLVGDDAQPSSIKHVPWVIRLACFLILWNEPSAKMKMIGDALPGGIIYQRNWSETMDTFSSEWSMASLLSAVVFVATTTFLAIPFTGLQNNADSSDASHQTLLSSLGYFCGLVCCALSVSSLAGAMTLKRAFKEKVSKDVHKAAAYTQKLGEHHLGYLKLGILISLPKVLLQWAYGTWNYILQEKD